MARFVVEMFGLPYEITGLREVEVELKDGVSLGDIIAALRRKVPALDGIVIRAGEDRLTENFAFNINGQFYFDDRNPQIKKEDHLVLLTLATVG